ncbi:DUF2752 domain-containing protein [Costertonia aggregata]|uniref:DUF2752 domain-containing protein n=1 Tax=Costertonia aggregata TaxID=343403 RepID=A0A7H9ASE9_9FLAO|nr:DUF2752 domain-containing protein [Costertonia aggregata]QLG46383.1 DUF2752 domain-containing protein [Costertonia aggregata]
MRLAATSYIAEDYMLPCISKRLMGFDCPGCGLQRSVALLFDGDFIGAFKMYPAIYTIILLFSFIGFDHFIKIKHSNTIIITLMISSVILILTNFLLKFL